MIADVAIKAVTQNTAFLAEDFNSEDDFIPSFLKRTPGLILIDEIDVHLHPKWQRQVVNNIRSTFPALQIVASTHSPIIISEVEAECIRSLKSKAAITPTNALGLDANRVLDEIMDVSERNPDVARNLHMVFQLIDDEDFDQARQAITKLTDLFGLDPEITRARSLIKFLEN